MLEAGRTAEAVRDEVMANGMSLGHVESAVLNDLDGFRAAVASTLTDDMRQKMSIQREFSENFALEKIIASKLQALSFDDQAALFEGVENRIVHGFEHKASPANG